MPEDTTTDVGHPFEVRTLSSFLTVRHEDLDVPTSPYTSLAAQLTVGLHRRAAEEGVTIPPGTPVTLAMDPASDDDGFDRNVIVFRAEAPCRPLTAEDHARAAEHDERVRLAWEAYDAATAALAAVQDPALAAVITLHRPQPQEYAAHRIVCQGCDGEGFDREPPAWPCTTVETIAAVLGIEVPDPWRLSLTYDRESGTWQRPA